MAHPLRSSMGQPSLAKRASQAAASRGLAHEHAGEPSLAALAMEASELMLDSYGEIFARLSWQNMGDRIELHLKHLDANSTVEQRIQALACAPRGALTRSGLAGRWLCRAVEADDAGALAKLIQAGADPWALAVGGWHPLDWAWEARARACGPLLAQELMGEEIHHMQTWETAGAGTYRDLIGRPFAASRRFMSSVFVSTSEASEFAGVSRTPCLAKLWQRSIQGEGGAARGPGRFASNLSILARAGDYPLVPKMGQAAALRAWHHALPEGEARAWVKSLVEFMEIDADTPSGKPGLPARL